LQNVLCATTISGIVEDLVLPLVCSVHDNALSRLCLFVQKGEPISSSVSINADVVTGLDLRFWTCDGHQATRKYA